MTTVLITGATGFVGGALAASLLAVGYRVLALSRNDADGERTRASVRDAARGFGKPLDEAAEQRLAVLEVDARTLDQALTRDRLADVCAAWHAAAEMSYASQKAMASYQANVVATAALHRLLAERAPQCQRFFYVSTAYTAGMDSGPVEEELHAGRAYDNIYQLTKCAAEHALSHQSGRLGLPVTLLRPTIVVGHAATGWARRNGFGFHMFIEALASVGRAGVRRVHFDLNAAARPDLIPIDRLASDAVTLTARAARGNLVDVFHSAGGLGLRLDAVLRTIGGPCGVDVQFGPQQTPVDKRLDRVIDPNRRFASAEWRFSTRLLEQALGCGSRPAATQDQLDRMVRWYLAGEEAPRRRRAAREAGSAPLPAARTSLAAQPV